jgi:hypothetical protein
VLPRNSPRVTALAQSPRARVHGESPFLSSNRMTASQAAPVESERIVVAARRGLC